MLVNRFIARVTDARILRKFQHRCFERVENALSSLDPAQRVG
jgi:hypothetical protein